MKVVILYRPKSEHAREVETYIHDIEAIHGVHKPDTVDVDSVEGTVMAELYDILDNPAILVLDDTGALLKAWVGTPLPLIDQVAYYLQ
jgi:hypothetical protein